ncbi:MAG: FAD-binding protein [Actinomycetota bacterium]
MDDHPTPDGDRDTDIVAVGGGAFGLAVAATVAAAAPHLRVTVLERDVSQKSNAEIGSGSVIAAGTRLQADAGVDDTPQVLAQDLIDKSHGRVDPVLVRTLAEESRHVVHWLIDDVGVPLELATEARRIGHSQLRLHATPERSGAGLIGRLRDHVKDLPNVDFRDRTPGTGLLHRDGAVTGVRAAVSDEIVPIIAGATVLASGGFAADRDLVGEHIPAFVDAPYIGVPGHLGDALRWTRELEAPVQDMQAYLGHGYVIDGDDIPASTRLNPGIMTGGGIMVNRLGQRFAREDQGYSEWAEVVRGQPGGVAIAIWDHDIHQSHAHSKMMVDAVAAGVLVGPSTVEELARTFGLASESLRGSIDTYNASVPTGVDVLGRRLMPRQLVPPLHGARVTGAIVMSLGGLRVDTAGRVMGGGGDPIPGLYAGGAAAAGLSGGTADGYLSGAGLLMSLVFGRLVGAPLAGAETT